MAAGLNELITETGILERDLSDCDVLNRITHLNHKERYMNTWKKLKLIMILQWNTDAKCKVGLI